MKQKLLNLISTLPLTVEQKENLVDAILDIISK